MRFCPFCCRRRYLYENLADDVVNAKHHQLTAGLPSRGRVRKRIRIVAGKMHTSDGTGSSRFGHTICRHTTYKSVRSLSHVRSYRPIDGVFDYSPVHRVRLLCRKHFGCVCGRTTIRCVHKTQMGTPYHISALRFTYALGCDLIGWSIFVATMEMPACVRGKSENNPVTMFVSDITFIRLGKVFHSMQRPVITKRLELWVNVQCRM